MSYYFARSRDASPSRFPLACPAAASFSPFGKRILRAVMSRDEETSGGKTKRGRERGKEREETFSIFPPTRRGQEVRRKERRRTAQCGRKRSVIPARRYFVTSSPSHPIPRRTTVRISELARQQCFSPVSLTVLLLQRRCSAPAMAEPGLTYALVSASR